MSCPSFATRLLAWYRHRQRDLPWRHTRDPWAIWISEVMLQQTRVEVVRERFPSFVADWPDPEAWAGATDEELQRAWQGLGYYRRARMLREGARAVVSRHGGVVPADLEVLGDLPGIGDYTRGAIASIAFGHPVVAIDGNVERVFARHRKIVENVKRVPGARAVRAAVEEAMDRGCPGDFNQAVMELGATVCTPRAPNCGRCPVAVDCRARAQGRESELPVLPKRPASIRVRTAMAVIPAAAGTVLIHRIPAGEINGGQWELPGPGILATVTGPKALAASLAARFDVRVAVQPAFGTIRHGITNHRIEVAVHPATLQGGRGSLRPAHPLDPDTPCTTATRKALALFTDERLGRSGLGPNPRVSSAPPSQH